ncbi:MAG: class I SAM-dependent methyltransferase, partial [bacterium]|nr:class I SAM-dependent methyltransferase [bacterium]
MPLTPVPPHQDGSDGSWAEKGDAAGYFPTAESASEYAEGIGSSPYHRDRLRAIEELLAATPLRASPNALTVLDFGIGDGGELKALGLPMSRVVGVDTSEAMVGLAREKFGDGDFVGLIGSVDAIGGIEDESIDLVFCVNTLGYLDAADQTTFFEQASRVVRSDGYLIVVTGNELFDLFALNSGTAEFFAERLGVLGAADLLTEGTVARFRNASRRNPLNFNVVLQSHGFLEIGQAFASWHRVPPVMLTRSGLTLSDARDQARDFTLDPSGLSPDESWRSLLQCSIFASLSRRSPLFKR